MEAAMSKLSECCDLISPSCDQARLTFDIRIVLGVLAAQLAATAQAALAGGVDRRYVAEIIAGTVDQTYAPSEKKPVVHYIDGEENLGRKQ
jgi:hypothetical protein